ncbi:hypothetical protein NH8B_2325 [Pseudogulbenkiania sp. NH8B]|uniref:LexA regulated protein n=1 Tax=Pseudogulbenkiania ferrooxidans 2002 TaxID=279714 RepID=B9YZN8_9NEIS|nr:MULTISPECIES: hypothetical protein [Pseudogulbenkiania]EEG09771.1 conserved hypothetical protein [Pseudogulbenkiania ferrooxidans 2002]BAK77139.1 hypothetical protein NH8B_2325 [Pseudogulbenkiania sp. NH8B]
MKRTDLEKNKGLKINGKMAQAGVPARYSQQAGEVLDKKERRKLDQAQGLVPFAVKLPGDLVKELQALAQERQLAMSDLAVELLKKGLSA